MFFRLKKQQLTCTPKALLQCLLFFLFIVSLAFSNKAMANVVVDEIRPLSLGTLAVPGNTAPTKLTLQLNEEFITEAGLIVVSPPHTGRYEVSGLPANVSATVTVTSTALTLMGGGAGEQLHLSSFETPNLFT